MKRAVSLKFLRLSQYFENLVQISRRVSSPSGSVRLTVALNLVQPSGVQIIPGGYLETYEYISPMKPGIHPCPEPSSPLPPSPVTVSHSVTFSHGRSLLLYRSLSRDIGQLSCASHLGVAFCALGMSVSEKVGSCLPAAIQGMV
jgi:hypothetical protein